MVFRYARSEGWGAPAIASAAPRVAFPKEVHGLFAASIVLSATGGAA